MNKRGLVKKTKKAIRKKKELQNMALSFNKGLILLAQGKAAEAYHFYHQAMGRACRSDKYRAILEGIKDLRNFVTKRGIQLDQGSPFLELLGGQFDLMRLLVSSKNWGQELRPDIFESICIQGQRLSEEDRRRLRSILKKKRKKGSCVLGSRGNNLGEDRETIKKRDLIRKAAKTVSEKKARAPEVPSDEEIRELLSAELPEKIKEEVCQEVAERLGISVKEVRELMEKLESGIPSRQLKKYLNRQVIENGSE
jgi:hypothetical protein